ncbi:hypothetical protein GCM10010259_13910 [Streptomyces daghestanicus]|uniref:Uncharacterized protein n=2 Tax=Streptomyces TaxID=1883 RepID=A0A918GJ79_STRGD|nr:hypothetical protein GCM10010238_32720 [Streptomyces niveoruber]GGU24678.1 hypothetical protein GCM10010259_13910 [Streptomyces daghestanicus]GHI29788.1 hypothetical protein Sdagh_15180 [Streptomyces daghestanicus]
MQWFEGGAFGLRGAARGEDTVHDVGSGDSDGVGFQPEDVLSEVVVQEGGEARGKLGGARAHRP